MSDIKKILYISLLICFFLTQKTSYSQYYSGGQDPASTKWMQIKTDNFQIIYPDGFDENAQYLCNVLEEVYKFGAVSLKSKPKRISIILHNQTVISNGLVAWAPKRSEFYTCPPQDIQNFEWLEELAIHEYRHVVQMSKMNQGISRILYFIFGEQYTAGIIGLFIPSWFMEGDAVCTETVLSRSGRGRQPSFEMELRAQLLEKGRYSYDKAVFNSYRDFTPNSYKLGYYLVANARKNYGDTIWNKALDKAAKMPFIITPFNTGIRKISGIGKEKLYKTSMEQLKTEWKKQFNELNYSVYDIISPVNKHYSNYKYAAYINDSLFIAEKTSIDDLKRFVIINRSGIEKVLHTPGTRFNEPISYSNGKLAWTELIRDMRWQQRSYSVVKIYDFKTKKVKSISSKTRYFSAVLSTKGNKIALIEVDQQNKSCLKIIKTDNGEIINSVEIPDGGLALTPEWNENDDHIVFTVLRSNKKQIAIIDLQTKEMRYYGKDLNTDIYDPLMHNGKIYFASSYSGIDNIYCFDIESNKYFMITSSKFGARHPHISSDGNKLLYSDYSAEGYKIVENDLSKLTFSEIDNINDNSIKLYEALAKHEKGIINTDSMEFKEYAVKRYRKVPHMINIHSWGLASVSVGDNEVNPGITFMSQDKLSTSILSAGYEYNLNEENGKYFIDYSYQGLYPIFDFRLEAEERDVLLNTTSGGKVPSTWKETDWQIGMRIPLVIYRGKYTNIIQPGIGYEYTKIRDQIYSEIAEDINLFNSRIYLSNKLKTSEKDITTRWGQVIIADFKKDYIKTFGSIFALESYLYFPGIGKHHTFKAYLGKQEKQEKQNNIYSDFVSYPRGYRRQNNENILTASFNYIMPLVYPDLRLGSLIYMKRIRTNMFFDYAEAENKSISTIYRSYGLDLITDIHILRTIVPISIGARFVYLPGTETYKSYLLFNMNFDEI